MKTLVEVSSFSTAIVVPEPGEDVTAESVEGPFQALTNRSLYLSDTKVAKAGDIMTGQLAIAPSSGGVGLIVAAFTGSNQPAAQFVGDGTGAGITAQGGATGPGAILISGAGAIGEALRATGYIRLNGNHINANVDPGNDHTVWPQSVNSSSCTIATDGAGNASVQTAGFNVNTASIFGTDQLVVTFKRTLPGASYRVALGEYGPYKVELVNGSRATTGYTLKVRDLATNSYVNLTSTSVTVFVTTVGF